jgi:hypothetical protein
VPLQEIYKDYNPARWSRIGAAVAWVNVLNSASYRRVTGREPDPSPVTKSVFDSFGKPAWYRLMDEEAAVLAAPPPAAFAKLVSASDALNAALAVCPICHVMLANEQLSGCSHHLCSDCVGKVTGRHARRAAAAAKACAVASGSGSGSAAPLCPLCRAPFNGSTPVAALQECAEEEKAMNADPNLVIHLPYIDSDGSGSGSSAASTAAAGAGAGTAEMRA